MELQLGNGDAAVDVNHVLYRLGHPAERVGLAQAAANVWATLASRLRFRVYAVHQAVRSRVCLSTVWSFMGSGNIGVSAYVTSKGRGGGGGASAERLRNHTDGWCDAPETRDFGGYEPALKAAVE
jgi:hypothetical protein